MGEIAFGILVGPYVLSWVSLGGFIPVLAEVGLFLLMFLAGLELDFSELERSGRKKLVPAMVAVLAMFALAIGATLLWAGLSFSSWWLEPCPSASPWCS